MPWTVVRHRSQMLFISGRQMEVTWLDLPGSVSQLSFS